MATAAEPVQQVVTFQAIRTRARRECRLFSRAVMRMPRAARVSIGIGLGLLAVISLYLLFSSAGSIPIAGFCRNCCTNAAISLI
jgi:hypothetical protein